MYTAYKVRQNLKIDGNLKKKEWRLAPKSPRFVDLVNGGPALYDTKAAMLWNERYLYVGFWVEEPFVSATQKKQNSPLFIENNIEFFHR